MAQQPIKSKIRESKPKATSKARATRASGQGDDVEPSASANLKRGVEMSADDAEVISKFHETISRFQKMSAPSSEETVFIQWTKETVAAIQEAKKEVATKKKSLKRRKDDTSQLCKALEEISDTLAGYIDVIKKLVNANVEGQQLYDTMVAAEDLQFDQNIWMRAVRAAAFDVLKVARWPDFFQNVWEMSNRHARDGKGFFVLLASQLLQRLLKALQTNKPFTPESLAYVRGFVDALTQHPEKTLPADMELSEHQNILSSVRAVLDFASAPSTVIAAAASLKDKAHFAAQALLLPQGKKLVEAAVANAEAKSASSEAMKDVDTADAALTQSGLCALQAAMATAGLGHCFNADHGEFVSKTLATLDSKGSKKGLKGADRERHQNVMTKARFSVTVIIAAHVHQELLPYVHQYEQALKGNADIPTNPLLTDTSCLLNLSDKAADVHADVVRGLKQLSELLHGCSFKFGRSAGDGETNITAGDAAAIKKDSSSKFKTITDAFSMFVENLVKNKAVCEQADISFLRGLDTELKDAAKTFNEGVDARLQHGVSNTVTEAVSSILKMIPDLIADDVKVDFQTFRTEAEQCLLFSTVLPEEGSGSVVHHGIQDALLFTNVVETYVACKKTGETEDSFDVQAKFISACAKLDDSGMHKLSQMNDFANKVLCEDTVNALRARCADLQKSSKVMFDKVAALCQGMFEKVSLQPSALEMTDEVLKIEKYDDIMTERIKQLFPMELTKDIATQARFLEEGMTFARERANAMDMDVACLVNLTSHEALYRDAIKWLPLC